ncbi:unnamed protein product, partial [Brugia timori]|uniref:Uncharacterized protein n=1 Tax=Brugia timori TaxID=42155 RepID=A0A0R3Q9W2_9BILA
MYHRLLIHRSKQIQWYSPIKRISSILSSKFLENST